MLKHFYLEENETFWGKHLILLHFIIGHKYIETDEMKEWTCLFIAYQSDFFSNAPRRAPPQTQNWRSMCLDMYWTIHQNQNLFHSGKRSRKTKSNISATTTTSSAEMADAPILPSSIDLNILLVCSLINWDFFCGRIWNYSIFLGSIELKFIFATCAHKIRFDTLKLVCKIPS